MKGDTFYKRDRFAHFPWMLLNDISAGFGHGGIHQNGDEYVDMNPHKPWWKIVKKDGTQEVWEVPEELMVLLDNERENGRDSLRRELRDLLEVNRR